MIALTRRKSISSTLSTVIVFALVGVVSSANISARFHLGIGSKTFVRYRQFFSEEHSRILVHRTSRNEIQEEREPSLLLRPVPTSMLATGTILDIVAQHHLCRTLPLLPTI